jgi:AraC-like DNA-binding protein
MASPSGGIEAATEVAEPGSNRSDASVVIRPSSPALAPFVSWLGYTRGRFPHNRELALPSGTMQLLVNLDRDEFHCYGVDGGSDQHTGGAALQGPYGRPALIDPAEQRAIAWVGFRVGGAFPFFRVPAAVSRDQLVDLADVWGPAGATLRDRLLEAGAAGTATDVLRRFEAILLEQATDPLDHDAAVMAAAKALHRGATVASVADSLGWTPKRLGTAFAERVGLAPKRFARVRRFQRLLRRATWTGGESWAELAADTGYHDQAHLIHDFRELAGLTPTEYAPRSPSERNHVPVRDPGCA